jgi:polar amino acid transport system substrate-binding protein
MKNSLRVLLMMVALLATVATVDAQQAADPRVADLVRAGKLRVALFLPQYTKDPATGELRGHGRGVVYVEVARQFAARLGIELQLVGYPTPPEVVACLKVSACDVGFLGINPARAAEIGFGPPLILVPFTYLVPSGSLIRSVTEADQPGIRIAVTRNHESAMALSRILKQAKLVNAETPAATFELLRAGQADAWASTLPGLLEYSNSLPGSRVLEDHYGGNIATMAVPKGQAGWLAYINEFIEEAKRSGLVQGAIERSAERGVQVAPPGNLTAQK